MSSEESYLAIQRYLSDEREPYAPGTQGNAKRKIRKAAACYVVRDGTLYYQRRQKGLDEFTELEVVLQAARRRELIDEAHVAPGGEHQTQQQTWDSISQKYWWRGILKQVKDYIRECSQCREKQERGRGWPEEAAGQVLGGRRGRRRGAASPNTENEEDDEEDDPETLQSQSFDTLKQRSARAAQSVAKHELVFVDSKGVVKQFLPKHGQTMLEKLNQQRLSGQFCDITLLIEGEEYRAHKAVLAACSDYFSELFIEKGAISSHEAVVDLSGFSKASFLPLLEFAYTSTLTFNFCVMADVATLARHLLMTEVLHLCESVHKQVEKQKLMVYQRGDTHTVVSSEPQLQKEEAATYMVTMQDSGEAVVAQGGEMAAVEAMTVLSQDGGTALAVVTHVGETAEGETLAVVTQSEETAPGETLAVVTQSEETAPGETLAVVTHAEETSAGETLAVVTRGGEASAEEALAVMSACWPVETQAQVMDVQVNMESSEKGEPVQEAFVLSLDPGKAVSTEVMHLSAMAHPTVPEQEGPVAPEPLPAPEPDPGPPKRKRGRPAKVKQQVVVEVPGSSATAEAGAAKDGDGSPTDSTYRKRLRQRSLEEGGYVRLHMGLERQLQGRKDQNQESNTQKQSQGEEEKPEAVPDSGEGTAVWAGMEAKMELEAKGVSVEAGTGPEEGAGVEAEASGTEPEGKADCEYKCSDCGQVFQRRYALIMHTLKHEKTRGYRCSLCSKEFQYAASLRAHLTRHKRQKSQRASVAARVLAEGKEAADGRTRGRTKREFVCDICGKTLPKLYSLRIHMLNHTGVRPHACKVCGKTFAHKHSLKMHRALHDALKQFQCTLCDKSFVSKRSLEEHTSVHTGESKYLCTTCGKSFHRASGLSKHLKRHQPKPEVRGFQCSHCDKSFYEAKDLQQHMNKHLGLKPFQCQVCGKCYSWKKDWYSHVKSHSVAEPFKCNICGKEFFEKALFRRHVKKATHGKKGRVKQNLERECEHCGRKFTQLREYRRHMNNHQGVKPFECLTCGVAWADARSLKRHVRTHTGERPYVCPVCQDAHIDARTLRKHMTKYHGDYLPGKIMLEKDTLQFHNQGTQVEHAISILAPELPPELQPAHPQASGEEIETVLITEETVEAVQAVSSAVEDCSASAMSTLSDQSIMQVVNYVLSQRAGMSGGPKLDEHSPDVIQTVEVEVAHVAEVE
ncbi:zinc finger and BTB domain-containing protein 11 isoform X2 [Scleropages formosus]|uniref:zinc finger and BTB domain-containing protein 11 isoform X2 n=1 Tax=Scleropages formosus TaxID=113540 RepID=UPI0010FAC674|nr:zinc finger and BTB domain-containing protein 11 isoform X2 [Scleropages formosus]